MVLLAPTVAERAVLLSPKKKNCSAQHVFEVACACKGVLGEGGGVGRVVCPRPIALKLLKILK